MHVMDKASRNQRMGQHTDAVNLTTTAGMAGLCPRSERRGECRARRCSWIESSCDGDEGYVGSRLVISLRGVGDYRKDVRRKSAGFGNILTNIW